MSSGTRVVIVDEFRYCGVASAEYEQCMFEGEVEIFYDQEVSSVTWECPVCGYEHEEEYFTYSTEQWWEE